MGDTKQQMTPSTPESKSLLSKFKGLGKGKKKKAAKAAAKATTVTDYVDLAKAALAKMIENKEKEYEKEKGDEAYNKKALAQLGSVMFHFEKVESIVEDHEDIFGKKSWDFTPPLGEITDVFVDSTLKGREALEKLLNDTSAKGLEKPVLETVEYHYNEIVDLCDEYNNLRSN